MLFPPPSRSLSLLFPEGPALPARSQSVFNETFSRKAAPSAVLSPAPGCGAGDLGVNASPATQQVAPLLSHSDFGFLISKMG